MSTLRVSNIEAKADASSPTINEKVTIKNSSGNVMLQLDGSTAGITTIGINTSGIVQIGSASTQSFFVSPNGSFSFGDSGLTGYVLRVGGGINYSSSTVLSVAPGVVNFDAPGVSGGRLKIDSSGNILVNNSTATGTASQPLQVTGGAYVSGSLGVGTTNPGATVDIQKIGRAHV